MTNMQEERSRVAGEEPMVINDTDTGYALRKRLVGEVGMTTVKLSMDVRMEEAVSSTTVRVI